MNKETQMLHEKLYVFLKESIPILRKTVDIDSLPTLRRYHVEKDKDRVRIVPHDSSNWWQIRVSEQILNLSSLHEAIDVCNKYQQIKSLNGNSSYAFGSGTSFYANNVPLSFLKELINRANGLKFRKKLFEAIFNDFLRYISPKDKSYACLVIPLDDLIITPMSVELEHDLRIRKLTEQELVDLINNCPILGHFYGTGFSRWFRCILEFDIPFKWSWLTQSQRDDRNSSLLALINAPQQYQVLKSKINQEIVILRAILNRKISSQTYAIDYRGWESVMFTGGGINYLPWARDKLSFPDPLTSKEIANYKKYRRKFLDLKDKKVQQRIFVAMRKLAFSMDKPYGGDQLMDTVSGLEGLLVDSTTEVRHKFAEHIAVLLEKDPKKREDLQTDMRYAYDLRSKVAHGSVVTDDIDAITSKIHVGQQPKRNQIDEFNRIQELRKKTRKLLYQAILVCIDKQTTDFNWDSSLMGTKISPLNRSEKAEKEPT